MDIDKTKRLLLCGHELQDWQTGTAMEIIDLLHQESLPYATICCILFDEETNQNLAHDRPIIDRAREFANDVRDILETLTKGGVVGCRSGNYRLGENDE